MFNLDCFDLLARVKNGFIKLVAVELAVADRLLASFEEKFDSDSPASSSDYLVLSVDVVDRWIGHLEESLVILGSRRPLVRVLDLRARLPKIVGYGITFQALQNLLARAPLVGQLLLRESLLLKSGFELLGFGVSLPLDSLLPLCGRGLFLIALD